MMKMPAAIAVSIFFMAIRFMGFPLKAGFKVLVLYFTYFHKINPLQDQSQDSEITCAFSIFL